MKFNDIIKLVETSPYSAFFYTPAYYNVVKSFILISPAEIINVYNQNDLKKALKLSDKLISKNMFGYCMINYEAGYLFEKKLAKLFKPSDEKVIQFVFFKKKNVNVINSTDIKFDEEGIDRFSIDKFRYNTRENQFRKNISKIKKYIKSGDTYQVNYTMKGKFSFSGSMAGFYSSLLFNQSAKYSAFINNGEKIIISLSPELFFRIKKNKIISQLMKGTIKRGFDANSDLLNDEELRTSEKNRAENVMIVDMIRNDLGRISRYGTVSVPELFKTEKYESLFQMISTIQGKLNKKWEVSDIVKNIFPSGSVTGAPKIRTMEIIHQLEKERRGIYTGSIGLFTKKEMVFNVAIRTLSINKKNGKGEIGIGAGIVWDSDPKKEFEESLLKSSFVTNPDKYFELLETMLCVNGVIEMLDDHLNRLKNASEFFLFDYQEELVRRILESEIQKLNKEQSYKIRLTLSKWGKVSIELAEVNPLPETIMVIVSDKRINSANKFQYFKTTNRKLYDNEFKKFSSNGFFEVLFLNENDELVEGSRTNIFIKKGNEWSTPEPHSGSLPGIYRQNFMNSKKNVAEKKLSIDDLLIADEVWLTNSIIKEIKVDRILLSDKKH
jgi:para-aminobenzoate synthetase/4-amino-4-deoxychorismate lyase